MLLLFLVLSSIPPNFCQFALASSSYISNPFSSSSINSPSFAKGVNVRGTRSRPLFDKFNLQHASSSSRFNASSIESEIAAIFKEFAYGSSTASTLSISSTAEPYSTPSTSMHAYTIDSSTFPQYIRNGVTEPKAFIGKQREVHTELKVTSDKTLKDIPEITSDANNEVTYSINTENKSGKVNTTKLNSEKPRPVVESYPSSFDLEKNNIKEVQVRITSALKKRGYEAIQQEIGRAWAFHVYLTGISFGVVAGVCLLSLSRISTCSQLLPRGYFITLHLMVFLASFLRCLLFLHDPYGAYGRLPSVLTSLLFNSVDPCLTTAYSVVLLVLLRAARIRLVPLNMQSPLVLAIICGIHIGASVVIDVSSGVLEDPQIIANLNITTQAVTAFWGSVLCLGYVVSFSGIEKAAQRQQGDLVRLTFNRKLPGENTLNKNSSKPSLIYAARLFLISTLLHGLLIAFIILNLVTTKVPISATSSEAWAWWTQTSLERIIEIALCVLLLATALVLTQSKLRNLPKEKEEKIFSILSHCGRGPKDLKNMDVYPVANEKCNILGDGSLRHSSLNSSINLSKNGWKHINDSSPDHQMLKSHIVINSIDDEYKKALQRDCSYNSSAFLFSPLQIVHNGSTLKATRNIPNDAYYGNFINEENQNKFVIEDPHCYSHLNNYSRTLPRNNYYCSQRSHQQKRSREQSVPKSNTIRGINCKKANRSDPPQFAIYNPNINSKQQHNALPFNYTNNKHENEYEVASYYTHSNASSSTHVYTRPYTSCYPAANTHHASTNAQHDSNLHAAVHHHAYRPPYIRNYETEQPKSEISVCSSSQSEIHVDYLTDASSSNDGLSNNTLSRSLTLPLYTPHCPSTTKDKSEDQNTNPDHTPDSAVGLDYSSQVEGDLTTPDNTNIRTNQEAVDSHTSFLRLSTTSMNEVLKNELEILGKSVDSGETYMNYSPLSLEETVNSPSVEFSGIKKSISTGNLGNLGSNSPSKSTKLSLKNVIPIVNNEVDSYSLNMQPITSI